MAILAFLLRPFHLFHTLFIMIPSYRLSSFWQSALVVSRIAFLLLFPSSCSGRSCVFLRTETLMAASGRYLSPVFEEGFPDFVRHFCFVHALRLFVILLVPCFFFSCNFALFAIAACCGLPPNLLLVP